MADFSNKTGTPLPSSPVTGKEGSSAGTFDRRAVLGTLTLIESVALTCAFLLGALLGHHWWNSLVPTSGGLIAIPCGLLTTLASVGLLRIASRTVDPHDVVSTVLRPLATALEPRDLLFLAVSSGVAEEVLFRGVLQPALGLWLSSIIFGLLHTGHRDLLAMGVWAGVMSLVLGALLIATGTLWAPILCHATHNLATLLYLRQDTPHKPNRTQH